jgi:hypothetical protein
MSPKTAFPPADRQWEVLQARAAREGTPCLVLWAACEAELVTWPPDDAAAYRREQGLSVSPGSIG